MGRLFGEKLHFTQERKTSLVAHVAPAGWILCLHPWFGGPGGAEDQPSDFYAQVKESLAELGLEPSWTFKYNAGANPIAFSVPKNLIMHSKIIEILKAAYEFA